MRRFILLVLFALLLAPAYSQSTEPLRITHGPWLQNMTADGVTICWTTNLPAVPGVLLVRTKPQTDSLIRNSTDGQINAGGILHKVHLTGLQPGTKYAYRIHSVEIMKLRPYQIYYGDTIKGKELSFTTLNPSQKSTHFMVVNDIHTNGTKLAGFLKSGKASEQDLLLYNGDIMDNFETEQQLLNVVIDTSVRYFASQVPFYYIRGNHETRGILSRKLKDYIDVPDNHYYYAIDEGPVHFVLLDCGEDKPDNNQYYYGLADFDRYRLQELEWLKEHVKTPEYQKASFRVIVVHMPILAVGTENYGQVFLTNHFGPVLKKAGADLIIAAHTHQHAWLPTFVSGFPFPMLINGTNNYVACEATKDTLSIRVISNKEEEVMKKILTREK